MKNSEHEDHARQEHKAQKQHTACHGQDSKQGSSGDLACLVNRHDSTGTDYTITYHILDARAPATEAKVALQQRVSENMHGCT